MLAAVKLFVEKFYPARLTVCPWQREILEAIKNSVVNLALPANILYLWADFGCCPFFLFCLSLLVWLLTGLGWVAAAGEGGSGFLRNR